jgi:hypothetical protein
MHDNSHYSHRLIKIIEQIGKLKAIVEQELPENTLLKDYAQMWKEQIDCDIVLCSEDQTFPCHKVCHVIVVT